MLRAIVLVVAALLPRGAPALGFSSYVRLVFRFGCLLLLLILHPFFPAFFVFVHLPAYGGYGVHILAALPPIPRPRCRRCGWRKPLGRGCTKDIVSAAEVVAGRDRGSLLDSGINGSLIGAGDSPPPALFC